jgi:hypothetical protein
MLLLIVKQIESTMRNKQDKFLELFDTSIPNISMHISNIFKDKELNEISVVKYYLTTAADGMRYYMAF